MKEMLVQINYPHFILQIKRKAILWLVIEKFNNQPKNQKIRYFNRILRSKMNYIQILSESPQRASGILVVQFSAHNM